MEICTALRSGVDVRVFASEARPSCVVRLIAAGALFGVSRLLRNLTYQLLGARRQLSRVRTVLRNSQGPAECVTEKPGAPRRGRRSARVHEL